MPTEFEDQSVSSVLKFAHIVFDRLSFKRLGFQNVKAESTDFAIGKQVQKTGDGQYQVTVSVKATRSEEYEIEISITGYCEIDENAPFKDKILEENAVAILFPYIRAELSLLTAQPETEVLTIPAVNINAMFRSQNQ